jgi:hypothetical protein
MRGGMLFVSVYVTYHSRTNHKFARSGMPDDSSQTGSESLNQSQTNRDHVSQEGGLTTRDPLRTGHRDEEGSQATPQDQRTPSRRQTRTKRSGSRSANINHPGVPDQALGVLKSTADVVVEGAVSDPVDHPDPRGEP